MQKLVSDDFYISLDGMWKNILHQRAFNEMCPWREQVDKQDDFTFCGRMHNTKKKDPFESNGRQLNIVLVKWCIHDEGFILSLAYELVGKKWEMEGCELIFKVQSFPETV